MFRDNREAKNDFPTSPAVRSYSEWSRRSSLKDQSISTKEDSKRKHTKVEAIKKRSPEFKSARFVH